MNIPILSGIIAWMDDNGMDYGPMMILLNLGLLLFGLFAFGVSFGDILAFFIALLPLWLPVVLFLMFFNKWTEAVGKKFWVAQGRTTLRIIPPQDIFKSPEAMEVVLAQIHNVASADNLMQVYLDGKRPVPTSLEIVSIGGEVRFYVNVKTKQTKDAFEANMYAQYPGVEIIEEPVDYAGEVPHQDLGKWTIMSFHANKKKDQEFPIKTYIDYGMDKLPKEEEKIDPMTPMLEVFSTAKPHERIYMQILITAHRKQSFKTGSLTEIPSWEKGVKAKIDELMMRDPKTKGPKKEAGDKDSDFEGMPRLTPGERGTIEAMERQIGKYAYETNIRWMYLTAGKFNGDLISPIIRSFSQYDDNDRNGIGIKWRTDFNYKDLIPGGKKKVIDALKKQELKEYKMRKLYPKNGGGGAKVFTVEELATMFHLPGKVAMTPTLTRVGSTRGEAPANLPTGELPN